jgi:uncharacterized membrane protein YbaN (DUF454 family)
MDKEHIIITLLGVTALIMLYCAFFKRSSRAEDFLTNEQRSQQLKTAAMAAKHKPLQPKLQQRR